MNIEEVISEKIQELESQISSLKSARDILTAQKPEWVVQVTEGPEAVNTVSSDELFNPRQKYHKQVYEYVLKNPWRTPGQVAKAFGWKEQKVSDVVCRLQQRGLVVKRIGNCVRAYVPEVSDLGGEHVRK